MTDRPIGRADASALLAPYTLHRSAAGLAYASAGAGETTLSLHGGLGGWDQSALLDLSLQGAPEGRRTLAVARPGYPGSTRAGRGDAEAQARLCLALLDELGIDRAVISAISGGGPVALALARLAPTRCRALVLTSACTGPMTSPVPLAMRAVIGLRRWPAIVDWMARRMERAPVRDAALAAALARDPQAAALQAALQQTLAVDLAPRLDGLVADIAMCAACPSPEPGEITVPTLVLHAADDPIVPVALARRAVAAIAGAESLEEPRGGHALLFAARETLATRVAAFLARHP